MGLTQTGLTANFNYMLNKQAHHVAQLLTEVNRRNAKSIEPTPEAEAEWLRIVNGTNPMTKYQSVCTPGYYNGEGTSEGGFLHAVYPKGALPFFDLLARWRDQEIRRQTRRDTGTVVRGSTCCHTFRATGITSYLQNGRHLGSMPRPLQIMSPFPTANRSR
jgi:hypothetical protein